MFLFITCVYLTECSSENLERLNYYLKNPTNIGKYKLNDFLDEEYLILDTRMSDLRLYRGRVPTLRSQRDGIFYIKNHTICELTGYEALLLQGFKKQYADRVKNIISDRHLLMQAGNAMTVNVIKELGLSLKYLFENEGDLNMSKIWMQFEVDAFNYLHNTYGENCKFTPLGKSDSTQPDIKAKTSASDFYIEIKSAVAQSGQFVLLPQENKFVFSQKNKSKENVFTNIIIDFMNNHFDRYYNAGTSGINLNIDSKVFAEWIINYYKSKNVKYVITKGKDFIIFPIECYSKYFDISAKYRIKKSGSGTPTKKDYDSIYSALRVNFGLENVWIENNKMFVSGSGLNKFKFTIGNYTYYLVEKNALIYEVRKLSNTNNMNVIFSIKLLIEQDVVDLEKFKHEF